MQIKQKAYYDRRARSRKFGVGDKVLLLLPMTVMNCYCSGKVHMKLLRWLIGWTIRYTSMASLVRIMKIC